MDYRFTLQASNPHVRTVHDAGDTNLADAIQTVFPLETESAILCWNWIHIPLSYKYDWSMMIDDVLGLVDVMLSEHSGNRVIQWPSNTFASTWRIGWTAEMTTVEAEWISVSGDTEAILAERPRVVLGSPEFISEWKRPLEVILSALLSAGYDTTLEGMERLRTTVSRIGGRGVLYRE